MTPLEKNLAAIRDEALAANLLVMAASRTAFALISNREELLAGINGFFDEGLAGLRMSGDEVNTHVREIARLQATHHEYKL